MASYYLKNINDDTYRHFKSLCDLQGITIREFLMHCITSAVDFGGNVAVDSGIPYLDPEEDEEDL